MSKFIRMYWIDVELKKAPWTTRQIVIDLVQLIRDRLDARYHTKDVHTNPEPRASR